MAAFDVGIDLGTTKIMIYRNDIGIVLNEPSIVAYNQQTKKVVAVGTQAYEMLGKTPSYIVAERPMANGVISDYHLTGLMMKEYLKRVCGNFFIKPRIVICIPSVTTGIERRAVVEAAVKAGARKVYLIEEPIAAAIGAGIDILKADGNMIVDIGGGTTDIAVISLSGIVCSQSIRIAGNYIDEELAKYFASYYKLSIGQRMAETVKKQVGTVFQPDESRTVLAKGRNLLTGYPQQIEVSEADLFPIMRRGAEKIIDAIRSVLEETPPELTGDLCRNGIVLTGGGALIRGLDELIHSVVKIPVRIAENPVEAVSIGTGKAFAYLNSFAEGFIQADPYH